MRFGVMIVLLATACGGSLSEEQRRQLREAQAQQAIVKVSEAELVAAAYTKGREILQALRQYPDARQRLEAEHKVNIRWAGADSSNAYAIETLLMEAYVEALVKEDSLQDNVQRLGTDTLIYSFPVTEQFAQGVVKVKGVWNVWIPKRELVLSLSAD
jgi:hypothetical protein